METSASRPLPVKLVVGIFIALLGVFMTLDNLYIIDAYPILRFWSLGLVAIGAAIWLNGNTWGGGAWIFVGLWILAYNLELIRWDIFDLWPVVLIVIGIVMLRQSFDVGIREKLESGSTLSSFTCCFGSLRRNRSKSFSGGTVTAIVGGSRIDLRQAEIDGDEAVLYTYAFMGGIQIVVPGHWEVSGHVIPLMGGFDDRTSLRPEQSGRKRLVIRGMALMGGVGVKNQEMGESHYD